MKKKADQIWGELADKLRCQLEKGKSVSIEAARVTDKTGISPIWWSAIAVVLGGVIWVLNS